MNTKSPTKWLRRTSVVVLISMLLVFVGTTSAQGATVRGRLDRKDGQGRLYPATYVSVTLNSSNMGRSSPAYTGADGMFYLYNVPPGDYYLEIWAYPGRPPLTFTIRVYDRPYTDINPILIQ
jgi:hypothetical protein